MAVDRASFVEPIAKELPMEYALELNRLIEPNGRIRGAKLVNSNEFNTTKAATKGDQFTSFNG